jgi:sigma-B regulation protein RsbU (phosphoserine phosphatase)
VLTQLNAAVRDATEAGSYATVFLAVVAAGGRKVAYANAGHNPPLLLRADGRAEWLSQGGLPAGIFEGVTLETHQAALDPGDVIVAYTDGVTEATDPSGEEYGTDRLAAVARDARGLEARAVADRIASDVRAFTRGAPHADDLTLVVVRAGAGDQRPPNV